MKRMIAAIVLLIITVSINIVGKIKVDKVCDKTTKILNQIESEIKAGNLSYALNSYEYIPDIELLSPYIYNEEITNIKSELFVMKSYIKENDSTNAIVCINKCIFSLKMVKDNERLSIYRFF